MNITKTFIPNLRWHFAAMLFVACFMSVSAVTYRLERVTTVKAGGLYVFEQSGYVMNGVINASALETVSLNVDDVSGLTGKESYVWTLETVNGGSGYRIKTNNGNNYLTKSSTSTDLEFTTKTKATPWIIGFQDDNTVLIQMVGEGRFLGYMNGSGHLYRAYSNDNLDNYEHAISVYELKSEDEVIVSTPVFSPAGGTYSEALDVAITCATDGASIYYTTDETQPSKSSQEYISPIRINTTTTIKAIAIVGEVESPVVTALFTIDMPDGGLKSARLSFGKEKYNVERSATNADFPMLNYDPEYNGKIVYSSSKKDVATVDEETGTVAIVGVGTTVITASAEETDEFSAGTASYTLNVYELGDGVFDFTIGYDYGSGIVVKDTDSNIDEEEKTWTSGNVSLTTYGRVSLYKGEELRVYKKGAGDSDKNSTCEISVPDGCLITEVKFVGTDCSRLNVKSDGGTAKPLGSDAWSGAAKKVTFEHPNGGENKISITKLTVTYIPKVTIGEAQYITYCNSEYALDFASVKGLDAYVVSEVATSTVTLKKVDAAPANTPVILNASEGVYVLKIIDSAAPVGTNFLKVSDGNVHGGEHIYALAEREDGVNFHRVNDDVIIPEGKCYLETDKIALAYLEFVFGPTAIESVGEDGAAGDGVYYNLNGQRVLNPGNGIYILNNRKVLIK